MELFKKFPPLTAAGPDRSESPPLDALELTPPPFQRDMFFAIDAAAPVLEASPPPVNPESAASADDNAPADPEPPLEEPRFVSFKLPPPVERPEPVYADPPPVAASERRIIEAPLAAEVRPRLVQPAASAAPPPVEEQEDGERIFARRGVQKLGIIGGKGVGKSYLFQAMVYRTYAPEQAGSLAYYLDRGSIRLFTALTRQDRAKTVNLVQFIRGYTAWNRLPQTQVDTQRWYRLQLPYRTGWLGLGRSALEVEFFDGSGEGFFQLQTLQQEHEHLWQEGYLDARIIVFCLPLWVAFPDAEAMTADDWRAREETLMGFEQVVINYQQLRDRHRRTQPVRSILALTMADDRRSALQTLRDRWITPYMDAPQSYLPRLRSGGWIARYLANARRVSNALHAEFAAAVDPRVSALPYKLDLQGGRPWLIPLSAIEGATLDAVERRYPDPDSRPHLRAPVPVHVELPLLVALCDRENALM